MEYIVNMRITAVAFDEDGAIWKGKSSYDSIEALLNDAGAVIKNIAIKKHKPQLLATFQAIKTQWPFSGLFLVFCCWIEASAM